MSSPYVTNYDDFQSTINFAFGDGGPWTCDLFGSGLCRLETRQHIDSGVTEYLAFGGMLGAMLKVQPELARPGQKMSYTWQFSGCIGATIQSHSLLVSVGGDVTYLTLQTCPTAGQPQTMTGEFPISYDGTFSIYMSAGYGHIVAYITGMRFTMSPSGNPPAPVGASQGGSSANIPTSGIAGTPIPSVLTSSRLGDTTGIPNGSGMASNGAPTTSPSDSASFSTLPPFGVSTSTIKGSVQNTQGPGVAPTPPQSSNNSGRASVIVGSVLGTASVLAGALILFLYLRRRPRRKSPRQAKTTKATTVHPSITPFYDEDALESASPRNEAPTIPSKDQKQPLPTPASPGPSAVVFGEKGR
ncbi:SubName: Full=Uncharacterized protein {ECO:0000313/EMBL:CCA77042.1} [Serendipita indica DSM 11827]|nr:SubName: Full=Uncharacterized protein {ECO:0000313/EMBL:CCA77042.1} [Serendipita indica DSM 11827]